MPIEHKMMDVLGSINKRDIPEIYYRLILYIYNRHMWDSFGNFVYINGVRRFSDG